MIRWVLVGILFLFVIANSLILTLDPLKVSQYEPSQEEEPIQDVAANTDGYETWETQHKKSSAVVLISDGEKAARLVLREGQEVDLPLLVPVTVMVEFVGSDRAFIHINDESGAVRLGEDRYFIDGRVAVFLAEVFVA